MVIIQEAQRVRGTKKKRNHGNLILEHCNGFTIGIADLER